MLRGDCFSQLFFSKKERYLSADLILVFVFSSGAPVNFRNKQQRTPLHAACAITANNDMITTLLNSGVNLDATDDDQRVALHYLAQLGKTQVNYVIYNTVNIGSLLICKLFIAQFKMQRSAMTTLKFPKSSLPVFKACYYMLKLSFELDVGTTTAGMGYAIQDMLAHCVALEHPNKSIVWLQNNCNVI